jgi:curved DNA-binding protein CbpA
MAEPAASSAYAVLGVPRAATAADIRDAFRRRAVLLHPDKGGDPQLFAQLRDAYNKLSEEV